MDYTCPYCGERIHNLNKECLIDLTDIIAERIESKANLGYQFRLSERLKSAERFYVNGLSERLKSEEGFYVKVHKRIIPKRSIFISFSKTDVEKRLLKLQNTRPSNNLSKLIECGAKDFRFEIQLEYSLKKGKKDFDSFSVLENEGPLQLDEKAERCCRFCHAPLSRFAGHFKNKTVILIRNSLLDKESLLKPLSAVSNKDYMAEDYDENKVDDSDKLFAVGMFLLKKNNRYLLLNVIEIDERVFALSNNELPECDRARVDGFLRNADYIWVQLKKEQEGFKFFNEAIKRRETWLNGKRCLIRCMSSLEKKTYEEQNMVLKLYRESCQAKRWISEHDKSGKVLKSLESIFMEKFFYFGNEAASEKTKMALNWILFLEGILEDQNNVYIGKTRGLLKTIFSKDSAIEDRLYYNLTQQTGFMI